MGTLDELGMLQATKLRLLSWLTEQSVQKSQQTEQFSTGGDLQPSYVREQLLQLPHELLTVLKQVCGTSNAAVLNGSSSSSSSRRATTPHGPAPAPTSAPTLATPIPQAEQHVEDSSDQSSSTVLEAIQPSQNQWPVPASCQTGASTVTGSSQQQQQHTTEGTTAICHEPVTPGSLQPKVSAHGAWASRSQAIWGCVSNTKQQALANRLHGTSPAQQQGSDKGHARTLSTASPSAAHNTPQSVNSKVAPCTPSSAGPSGGIKVLRTSTPSHAHTPQSVQTAVCSRLQATPISADARMQALMDSRQRSYDVEVQARTPGTQEGCERAPASNSNSKAGRRQGKTARRVAPTVVSPSSQGLNAPSTQSSGDTISKFVLQSPGPTNTASCTAVITDTANQPTSSPLQPVTQVECLQGEIQQAGCKAKPVSLSTQPAVAACINQQLLHVAASVRSQEPCATIEGCSITYSPATAHRAQGEAGDAATVLTAYVEAGSAEVCSTCEPSSQGASHTTHTLTWTAWHAVAAELHAQLLLSGYFHESVVDDITRLITLLTTSYHTYRQYSVNSPAASSAANALDEGDALPAGTAQSAPSTSAQSLLNSIQGLLPRQGQQVPWAVLQQYAGAVLDGCALLVCGMGSQVHELLLACQAIHVTCPKLTSKMEAQQRVVQMHPQQQASLTLQGLRAGWTSSCHERHNRLPVAGQAVNAEQGRLQANKERCRDAFHALTKEASALAAALAEPGAASLVLQELRAMGTGRQPNPQRMGCGSSTALAKAIVSLQQRVRALVGVLHPRNLAFLADLFTSSVLQAAATGEAAMNAAVASLAQQDPSRFARLSARLQSTGTVEAATGAPIVSTRAPRTLPHAGLSTQSAGPGRRQQGSVPSAGQSGGQAQNSTLYSTSRNVRYDATGQDACVDLGKDVAFAATERLACSVQLIEDFAPVQRGYALICDLADSRELVNALGTCMAGRLTSCLASLPGWAAVRPCQAVDAGLPVSIPLCHDKSASSSSSGLLPWAALNVAQQRLLHEQLTICCTLANYLSYLAHAHHPDSSTENTTWGTSSTRMTPSLHGMAGKATAVAVHWPAPTFCAVQLLQAAVQCSLLPIMLPCVVHLLWHAHSDMAAVLQTHARLSSGRPTTPVHTALHMLCTLRQHPELQPVPAQKDRAFGAAALAARSLVDDLLLRVAGASGCSLQQLPSILGCEHTNDTHTPAADLAASQHHHSDNSRRQLQQQAAVVCTKVQGPQPHTAKTAIDSQQGKEEQLVCGVTGAQYAHESLHLDVWDLVADPCLLRFCCPGFDVCCRRLRKVIAAQQNQPRPISRAPSATLPLSTPLGRPISPRHASMQQQHQQDSSALASPVPSSGRQDLATLDSYTQDIDLCAGTLGGTGMYGLSVGSEASSSQCSPARGTSQGAVTGGRPHRTIVPRKVSAVRVHGWNPRAALTWLPPASLLPPGLACLLDPATTAQQVAAGQDTHSTDGRGTIGAAQPEGHDSSISAQLQQALLLQYSGDEQPVKLKDVCTMVSEVTSANTVSSVLGSLLPPALTACLQTLYNLAAAAAKEALQASSAGATAAVAKGNVVSMLSLALQPYTSQSKPTVAQDAPPGGPQQQNQFKSTRPVQKTSAPLPPFGNQHGISQPAAPIQVFSPHELNVCINKLIPAVDSIATATVKQVLADAEPMCRTQLAGSVVGALAALLPSAWPQAVLTSASAIAHQQALTSCAHRLVQQVPAMVLSQLHEHVEAAAKQALKNAKLSHLDGVIAPQMCAVDMLSSALQQAVPAGDQTPQTAVVKCTGRAEAVDSSQMSNHDSIFVQLQTLPVTSQNGDQHTVDVETGSADVKSQANAPSGSIHGHSGGSECPVGSACVGLVSAAKQAEPDKCVHGFAANSEECDGMAQLTLSPSGTAAMPKDGAEGFSPSATVAMPKDGAEARTQVEGHGTVQAPESASKNRPSMGQQIVSSLQQWFAACSMAASGVAQRGALEAKHGQDVDGLQGMKGHSNESDCHERVLQQLANCWMQHTQQRRKLSHQQLIQGAKLASSRRQETPSDVGAEIGRLLIAAQQQGQCSQRDACRLLTSVADLMAAAAQPFLKGTLTAHAQTSTTDVKSRHIGQGASPHTACIAVDGVQQDVASMLAHAVLHMWIWHIQKYRAEVDPWSSQSSVQLTQLHAVSQQQADSFSSLAQAHQHEGMAGIAVNGGWEGEVMGCLLQIPVKLIVTASELGSWVLMHDVRAALQDASMAQLGFGQTSSQEP